MKTKKKIFFKNDDFFFRSSASLQGRWYSNEISDRGHRFDHSAVIELEKGRFNFEKKEEKSDELTINDDGAEITKSKLSQRVAISSSLKTVRVEHDYHYDTKEGRKCYQFFSIRRCF